MFCSGHRIGTPRARSTMKPVKRPTVVKHSGYRNDTTWEESENNMSFPKVESPILPVTRKRPSCSFVKNQKVYLRMKGFSVDDVYSLKRHTRKQPNNSDHDQTINRHLTNPDLNSLPVLDKHVPKTINKTHRGFSSQKEDLDLWKPVESRKPQDHGWQTLYSILNGCKEALNVRQQVTSRSRENEFRPEHVTSRPRGNETDVMTPHNRQSFYMDGSGFLSPMTGRRSNMY